VGLFYSLCIWPIHAHQNVEAMCDRSIMHASVATSPSSEQSFRKEKGSRFVSDESFFAVLIMYVVSG
jgi:ABC-type Na+ transport system ATPase subunit NatA